MDRLVQVVNGRWARTSDSGWLFIANSSSALKKLNLYQGDKGFIRSKEIITDEFGLCDEDLNLTFQWPEWLDVGVGSATAAAWEKTCPVTVQSDETMEIYFAALDTHELLPLYISQVSVEKSVDANALRILEEKAKYVMEVEVIYDFNYEDNRMSGMIDSNVTAPTFNDQCKEGLAKMQIAVRDYKEGDAVYVGRVFTSKEDCRATLVKHAANRGFRFSQDHWCKKLTTLACRSAPCPWRVYITKLESSDGYQVVSANLRHTCSVQGCRIHRQQQATAKFMESLKKIDFQKHLDNHRADVLRWKAWDSRKSDCSFAMLPSYLACITQSNPGSITRLETDDNKFKRMFIAFSFSIRGFASMRRVIVLGAAPLLGSFMGCLLTASCQDANFQAYPLAFAVVDCENDDSWDWFLRMLITVIPDSDDLAFVSKWHSSIYTSLREVYRKASHGACVVHLHQEVCRIFKNRHLADLVSEAACAYCLDDFNAAFAEVSRIEPECANYLETIGFNHWTRTHFTGNRYNMMTTNVAESLNAVLKEALGFPIIKLLEFILRTLMTWFSKRREAVRAEKSPFSTNGRKLIHDGRF